MQTYRKIVLAHAEEYHKNDCYLLHLYKGGENHIQIHAELLVFALSGLRENKNAYSNPIYKKNRIIIEECLPCTCKCTIYNLYNRMIYISFIYLQHKNLSWKKKRKTSVH